MFWLAHVIRLAEILKFMEGEYGKAEKYKKTKYGNY